MYNSAFTAHLKNESFIWWKVTFWMISMEFATQHFGNVEFQINTTVGQSTRYIIKQHQNEEVTAADCPEQRSDCQLSLALPGYSQRG